jgi:hypothetical protein
MISKALDADELVAKDGDSLEVPSEKEGDGE